jgi:hypothetical protein
MKKKRTFRLNFLLFLFKCIGYHKVITRPMDLRTIKEKINSYGNMIEFLADVRLMFNNCSTFNRVSLIKI